MSESLPEGLLFKLRRASPQTLAAIECLLAQEPPLGSLPDAPSSLPQPAVAGPILCGSCEVMAALARLEAKVDAVRQAQRANGEVEREVDLDDEQLRRIYARVVLTSARASGGREAPLKEVFDRYCLDGLSARKVSEALGCSKSTVMNRLATLKKIAGVPAAKLRAYKPTFERTEESLRDSRARRGCRKQAAYGDDGPAAE